MYTGFGIGYGILVLRGFMRSIPKDLDEAYIDGCGKLRLYYIISYFPLQSLPLQPYLSWIS